jgi:hypothetical protein
MEREGTLYHVQINLLLVHEFFVFFRPRSFLDSLPLEDETDT